MTGLVLLHGLGRSARSMQPLERAAAARGFVVLNLPYESRGTVAELAEHVAHETQLFLPDARLHFVTHSIGAILLRAGVAAGLIPLDRIGRAVMLAPPNQGSELAAALQNWWLLGPVVGRVAGPAAGELGVDGFPARLPPVEFETGIIAGTRSMNPLHSLLIPGDDDGKVSLERTVVAGMRDFLVVPRTHTFIMRAPDVIAQALHFLEHGAFER